MNNIKEIIVSLKTRVALAELIGPDEMIVSASDLSALIAQLEAAHKRIAELDNSESQLINERDHAESTINSMFVAVMSEKPEWSNMYQFIDAVDEVEDFVSILKQRAESAEAALSAANEKLNKVITDDWNEIGPTYPAHYTPVIVAMNGVTQHITYQIEEGDNGDYWQPVSNEDADGAPMTQFQHWKPLPAGFTVEE
ncbi:hypothetical protein [Yersinia mollaretii]|uniref:hypothetical protein n=1 Tax=Yersinia mollaretii TaxID=33060 RepID=UPI0011AA756E|nr:hypothetical protein [Yersinia mollaretii]